MIVGAVGQTIFATAGLPSGSTSSIVSWSCPIWLEASGVVGKDGVTGGSFPLEAREAVGSRTGAVLCVVRGGISPNV